MLVEFRFSSYTIHIIHNLIGMLSTYRLCSGSLLIEFNHVETFWFSRVSSCQRSSCTKYLIKAFICPELSSTTSTIWARKSLNENVLTKLGEDWRHEKGEEKRTSPILKKALLFRVLSVTDLISGERRNLTSK